MIWKPQPLSSGGLILSYQCSNQCRHCLYASSPSWKKWASKKDIDSILHQIQAHSTFLTGLHIGGGEPMLKPELTAYTIQKAKELQLPIDYVETNAFWCWNDAEAESVFCKLRDVGLSTVLISVSPFHLEYVPMEKVNRAIRIGRKVFGSQGVLIYTQSFYDQFQSLPENETLPFEDYVNAIGLEQASLLLSDTYSLIPNGRVATQLAFLYQHDELSRFWGENCEQELSSPYHIHVDCEGNYIAGLCAGISLGSCFQLSQIYDGIELDNYPLLRHLIQGGVESLFKWVCKEYGFIPQPKGYIAKCHLCLDIRRYLVERDSGLKELAPLEFYNQLD